MKLRGTWSIWVILNWIRQSDHSQVMEKKIPKTVLSIRGEVIRHQNFALTDGGHWSLMKFLSTNAFFLVF